MENKIDSITIKLTAEEKTRIKKYASAIGWTSSKLGGAMISAALNELKAGKRSIYDYLPRKAYPEIFKDLDDIEEPTNEET